MRILFVSNFFPPYTRGGYEQWCEDVALALVARGHNVAVLSSRHHASGATVTASVNGAGDGGPLAVYRLLHTEVEGGLAQTLLRLLRNPHQAEDANRLCVDSVVAQFCPDVVLIWGMWNISRSVPQHLERLLGSQVGYYFCDYWPTLPSAYVQRLREPARRPGMQRLKTLFADYFLPRLAGVGAIPLQIKNPICVSFAVRDILVTRGVGVSHAKIIHGGTDSSEFDSNGEPACYSKGPLRLLYMGRLERIKGVHTVIQAIQKLGDNTDVLLDILGAGDPHYTEELRTLIVEAGLSHKVRFMAAVQRREIPALLAQYDVLVFSSEWEEPFARTVLEGMAAGLGVIGTTTGGTGEILVEGETGLTYPAGDAACLARQISRVAADPLLRKQISEAGRAVVRQRYTLVRMVDELESALWAIANKPVRYLAEEDFV